MKLHTYNNVFSAIQIYGCHGNQCQKSHDIRPNVHFLILLLLLNGCTDSLRTWWEGTPVSRLLFPGPSEVEVKGQRSKIRFCEKITIFSIFHYNLKRKHPTYLKLHTHNKRIYY